MSNIKKFKSIFARFLRNLDSILLMILHFFVFFYRLALFMKDEVANNDGNIQHSYDYFVVASSRITGQFLSDRVLNHPLSHNFLPYCAFRGFT